MNFITLPFVLLLLSVVLIIFLMFYTARKKPISQLQLVMFSNCLCTFILSTGVLVQNICYNVWNINPIYFENFIYIGTCLLPVSLLFTSLVLLNTKLNFKKRHLLLFIIPIISMIMVWTNDFHHLFYTKYSLNINEMEYGAYFYIHTLYSYGTVLLSIIILIYSSIKTSGFFSRQSILILLGSLIPTGLNVLGYLGIINITVYATPISFTITILLYTIAIFKFKFLNITPIAIQRIVDRISDSYIVLGEDNLITDFNKTFITTFKINNSSKIRGTDFKNFLKTCNLYSDFKKVFECLPKVHNTDSTISFELYIKSIDKFFNLEINSISSNGQFLGTLMLFKDITQHKKDIDIIQSSQNMLVEQERLATLGQMIGGISHNLKTPIMSIAGAAEGLTDLVTELDESIGDPEITEEDFHDIAKDMKEWITKIHSYTGYMSDIITAVKGQAVTLSEEEEEDFTIYELIKRVEILMKNELQNAHAKLEKELNKCENVKIEGNINSLVQVINNLISNGVQSYKGKPDGIINLETKKKGNNLILTIEDHGCGISEDVKDKLFKEMITTKGKNGTGLGLFMSYSTIKGKFKGDMTFESKENVGTKFTITLPIV